MNRQRTPAPLLSVAEEAAIEDIEVTLLLEAVCRRWGFDFRDYAPASLKRRIRRAVEAEGVASMSALQERLLRDPAAMQRFLNQATVSSTSMFRDPDFYRAFRRLAAPWLRRWPTLRVWHAGCATGEEVYSLAILLHEEDLLSRTRIYATDLNQTVLDIGREGIYPLEKMQEYTENYQASNGQAAFSEYYQARHGHVVMRAKLSKNVVWAQHNLVTDASFNEFQLILCRNVLIYFDRRLQERVHRLLYDSLAPEGLLALGRQESLRLTPYETRYQAMDIEQSLYLRVGND